MSGSRKFQINFENNPRFKDSKFTKMVDSDLIKKQTEEFLAKGGEIKKLPDIGKYPSPKTKKEANDILKRISYKILIFSY